MDNRHRKGYTKKVLDLYRTAPDLLAHRKIYNNLQFLAKVIQQFKPSRLQSLTSPTSWYKYWNCLDWQCTREKLIHWNVKYNLQIDGFDNIATKWFNVAVCPIIRGKIIEMKMRLAKYYNKVREDQEKIKIEEALQRRNVDLKENPKRFLNSVLARSKDCVTFKKLIIESDEGKVNIITNLKEIEVAAVDHYQHYAAQSNNSNMLQALMQEDITKIEDLYIAKDYIKEEWYNELAVNISMDELKRVIRNLPNNKAPGLSQLLYEVYKHASEKFLKVLILQFNEILVTSTVPNSWTESAIFSIPKKNGWTGQLKDARPISLLECDRKIFMKILQERLNRILGSYDILNPFNKAGIKGYFTAK